MKVNVNIQMKSIRKHKLHQFYSLKNTEQDFSVWPFQSRDISILVVSVSKHFGQTMKSCRNVTCSLFLIVIMTPQKRVCITTASLASPAYIIISINKGNQLFMYKNVVTEMSSHRNGQTKMSRDRNGPDRNGQTESARPKRLRPKRPDRNSQTESVRAKSCVP